MQGRAIEAVNIFIIVSGFVGFCRIRVSNETSPDYVWSSRRWILNAQDYCPMINAIGWNLKNALVFKPNVGPLFWLDYLFVSSGVRLK